MSTHDDATAGPRIKLWLHPHGMSHTNLTAAHVDDLRRLMTAKDSLDPVGVIIDVADPLLRDIAAGFVAGLDVDDVGQVIVALDRQVEEHSRLGLDMHLVYAVDWPVFLRGWRAFGMEDAPSYRAALNDRTADESLIVVADGEDVTCCLVNLGLPVRDGQHRVRLWGGGN